MMDIQGKKTKPMFFGVNPIVPEVNTLDKHTRNERYRSKPYSYSYGL